MSGVDVLGALDLAHSDTVARLGHHLGLGQKLAANVARLQAAELVEARAAVAELIEVVKFAELLKFKQSTSNANAAFLDYRDCVHLQTIARAARARAHGAQS